MGIKDLDYRLYVQREEGFIRSDYRNELRQYNRIKNSDGGMEMNGAYTLSDIYINKADEAGSPEEVIDILGDMQMETPHKTMILCGVLLSVNDPESYFWLIISSGWKTSSNFSAVRNPSLTQASLSEMFSSYARWLVLAAFSYPM